MTLIGLVQIAFYSIVLLILTKPLGLYMTQVMEEGGSILEPVFGPVERTCYRLFGIRADEEMHWTDYAFALLSFSLVGALLTYVLLRLQGMLPLNPMGFSTARLLPMRQT